MTAPAAPPPAAAKAIEVRPFLAAVVHTLVLKTYEGEGVTAAFCELIGANTTALKAGMTFRLNKGIHGRIAKLSAEQLRAAALWLIAQPNKGGTYDTEQYGLTEQLAGLLKIDMDAISKAAAAEAEAAYKAKLQTSAKSKLRKGPKKAKRGRPRKKGGKRK